MQKLCPICNKTEFTIVPEGFGKAPIWLLVMSESTESRFKLSRLYILGNFLVMLVVGYALTVVMLILFFNSMPHFDMWLFSFVIGLSSFFLLIYWYFARYLYAYFLPWKKIHIAHCIHRLNKPPQKAKYIYKK